jgi:hypothetical protein
MATDFVAVLARLFLGSWLPFQERTQLNSHSIARIGIRSTMKLRFLMRTNLSFFLITTFGQITDGIRTKTGHPVPTALDKETAHTDRLRDIALSAALANGIRLDT